jgi:hypothetical protein
LFEKWFSYSLRGDYTGGGHFLDFTQFVFIECVYFFRKKGKNNFLNANLAVSLARFWKNTINYQIFEKNQRQLL